MDHEKIGKIAIFSIIICWITEYSIIIYYFNTICNEINIEWLSDRVHVEEGVMKQKPAMMKFQLLMVLILIC